MQKFSLVASLLFFVLGAYAQQEAQYTQFMYNKLALNPGYAGSYGLPCISCIHRTQWIGFEGAPSSQVLNFHLPAFSERVGLGLSVAHDRIGPTKSSTASLVYAYRLKMKKGNLAIGTRGTIRSYRINWQNLKTTHSGDDEIPSESTVRILPNFGAGVYYDADNFYVGLSLPNIITNDLSFSVSNTENYGRVRRHFYLMGGYIFQLSKSIKLKPAALIKFVSNSPLDIDANVTAIFMDKFWVGLSYRLGGDSTRGIGESLDLLVQYQVTPLFRVGAAYDYTLSKLQNHSSGSIEIQLDYCFQSKKKKEDKERLTNPRFFQQAMSSELSITQIKI